MTTPADQPDLITWLRNVLDQREAEARLLCKLAGVADTGTWLRTLLAEVDAKRRILDLCEIMEADPNFLDAGTILPGDEKELAMRVLMLLALPYADRPGYREEWRP